MKILIGFIKFIVGVENYIIIKKKLGLQQDTNSFKYQRKWSEHFLNSNKKKDFSNHWGKINEYNKNLGDYRIVKKNLMKFSKSHNTVLEIGCLDGKWSEVLIDNFKNVFLLDLNDKLLPFLKKRFGKNFKFYTTKGNELSQLNNNSVDLIFSMDSLTRVPNKRVIYSYLKEFKRVLKNNGQVYVHLPCNIKKGSIERGFTSISKNDIVSFSEKIGFKIINFDEETLEHGILLNLLIE